MNKTTSMNRAKRSLAVVVAGVAVAVTGVGAGSAQAAVLPCHGVNIAGSGSSLQRAAQTFWTADFNTNAFGCSVAPNKPTVTYTVTSSGTGMNEWHAGGVTTFNTTYSYIGTDDAPTVSQLANMGRA